MSVKVISRDEVEINGEKWKRSYFESMSRVTPTGGNSACSKVGADEILRLMDAYGVETSEKPENPFTGPHWQGENFAKDIVFNAWRRDCDLADELTRIRELLAGKSVIP